MILYGRNSSINLLLGDDMPEIRFNPVTGDWVVIATERAKRPEDFVHKRERKEVLPYVETCPFCPGNEAKTPPETFALRDPEGRWIVRSVPNRFSALSPSGDVVKQRATRFRQSVSGVGLHEVIIETPDHSMTTALLPRSQIESILSVYRNRLIEFYRDPRIQHVVIFKNHGAGAGTSLEHPHSQIVGTPVFPGQVMTRVEEAIKNYYYIDFGECLYCSLIKDEMDQGLRIVNENDSFVAFIPYAAASPFHLWIFPKTHRTCFGEIDDREISDLAALLKDILLRLYIGLDNPDFNYMIRCLSPAEAGSKFFHWYIALIPRVTQMAGFEMGTGMFINTALPEESAKFLRELKLPDTT